MKYSFCYIQNNKLSSAGLKEGDDVLIFRKSKNNFLNFLIDYDKCATPIILLLFGAVTLVMSFGMLSDMKGR